MLRRFADCHEYVSRFMIFMIFQDFSIFNGCSMERVQDCVKCMFFSSFFQVLPFVIVFRSSAVNLDFCFRL